MFLPPVKRCNYYKRTFSGHPLHFLIKLNSLHTPYTHNCHSLSLSFGYAKSEVGGVTLKNIIRVAERISIRLVI